jgi:hypothetical protein
MHIDTLLSCQAATAPIDLSGGQAAVIAAEAGQKSQPREADWLRQGGRFVTAPG